MKPTIQGKGPLAAVTALLLVGLCCAAAAAFGNAPVSAAASVPLDHYVDGDASNPIEANHAACSQCHDGLAVDFTEVSTGSALMKKHVDAWDDYVSGTSDEDARKIVEENLDLMEKCFSVDANGQACAQCHDTAVGENGSIALGDFDVIDYCLTCHDEEDIVEETAEWHGDEKVNPHESHLGTIDCGNCHKIHGEKETMYCDECHDWGAPDDEDAGNWTTATGRYSQTR